jgi:protein ImuB
MSRWIALLSAEPLPLAALGWWALQFTPRVARMGEAIVMELQSSLRLFGGSARLCQRVMSEARALGCAGGCTALTAGAALAQLRGTSGWDAFGVEGWETPPAAMLDPLPMHVLPAVANHVQTLAPLGCRTLRDVRQLPRGGLSRRFGAGLLAALDQAYGLSPEVHEWLTLPDVFEMRLELPGRVERAEALLHGAQHLLVSLCAWLAGRQAGVRQFTLQWLHDGQRRDDARQGQIVVQLADPSRDLPRLTRLLGEHLRRITLIAPVGELCLRVDDPEPLQIYSDELFGDLDDASEAWAHAERLRTPSGQREQRQHVHALLERLSTRLGASHVLQGQLKADHRPEQAQCWVPMTPQALSTMSNRTDTSHATLDPLPQPAWLLPEPLMLPMRRSPRGPGQDEQAVYLGALQWLAGPHRVEAGWWDTQASAVGRDYYIAHSPQAGLLWVFRERALPEPGRSPWFLHGLFA